MLEKFRFWKKQDLEFPPGELQQFAPSMEQAPTPPLPTLEPAQQPQFQQSAQQQLPGSKDLEVIAAKLDLLKAQLDNIIQRLEHLERGAQEPKFKW